MTVIKNIGIMGNEARPNVQQTLACVLSRIGAQFPKAKIALSAPMAKFERPEHAKVCQTLRELAHASDVLFSIGGDGTMLLAARAIAQGNPHAQLIGINAGKLGFLSENPVDEIEPLVKELAAGSLVTEERLMLRTSVTSESGEPVEIKLDNLDPARIGAKAPEFKIDALNEIVIDNYGSTRMLTLDIYVGAALLGTIRADGIIVSTPTGSTGYAISAGGPIVEPTSPVMLITPIAPHSLTVRPIIVPERARITLRTSAEETHQVLVVADGQEQAIVTTPAVVVIEAAPNRLQLLRRRERSYFDLLRQKLFWNVDRRDTRL